MVNGYTLIPTGTPVTGRVKLLAYIKSQGFTQQQLCELLEVPQPDVSSLLNGKVSRFSVGKLIKLAGKLNLGAQVKLITPKHVRRISVPVGPRRKNAGQGSAAA